MKTILQCGIILFIPFALAKNASGKVLIDPTQPAGTNLSSSVTSAEHNKLTLNAVIINGANKQAIINGERLNEGQHVAGKTLTSISQNRVVLRDTQGSQELFLNHSEFIKDANDGY
jgi:MSHA biogenesis protein MshK